MEDRENEQERKRVLLGYVQRLGWPLEPLDEDEPPVVSYAGESGPVRIQVVLDEKRIEFSASCLDDIPQQSRWSVRKATAEAQRKGYNVKFEDSSDGRYVRAHWYMAALGQLPSYEHFEQTIHAFALEVDRWRPGLEKAARQSTAFSGKPEDRIPASAELCNLGRDLVDLAHRHEILPMYVREDLVENLIAALAGPRKQILLVGESGTGKNALVQALATWIAEEDPRVERAALRERHIYECVPASFQLSVMYAHELENKTQLVALNCMAENAILFVDKTHAAVTAGRLDEDSDRTIATLLQPFLSRNEITIIGATDQDGLKLMMKRNPAFVSSFHVLRVPEPGLDETRLMVADRIAKMASGSDGAAPVAFGPGVGERVIGLAERFLRSQRFPGKALTLLNEVVAQHVEIGSEKPVSVADVDTAVTRLSGLRGDLVGDSQPLTAQTVVPALEEDVIGQLHAVRTVADVVIGYKAELIAPGRPIATMLFVGPTGVGKTQLARSLARYLFGTDEALLRYDMSEYADAGSYGKLCGRRATDDQGRLTRDVMARPFSVILLDEIEKAHDSVFNVLLQVLGEARMTDETGTTASFLNTIIIMTSNVGSHLFGRGGLGFGSGSETGPTDAQVHRELEKVFSPEFLNRIGHVVHFDPLSEATTKLIAKREIMALQDRPGPKRRSITLSPTQALLDEVARQGYDAVYGARAMQRTVERLVAKPLGVLLAATPELAGTSLELDWEGEGATVTPSA